MMKKPATFVILLACLLVSMSSISQKTDSIVRPFSQWTLRVNPISFFEKLGGVHVGVETNIDTKGKLFFVSEYGYIFINKQQDPKIGEEKNTNRLSGFESKQELKMVLKKDGQLIKSMAGLELNYQQAGIKNTGWFGMGTKGTDGLYPYFRYQDFREQFTHVSLALKYILKAYPFKNENYHFEFFGGPGIIHKKFAIKDAEGELHQPDATLLYENRKDGFDFYLAAGCRFMFRLK